MRIQIISDVHAEFHRDCGQSFVDDLKSDGVDVLVIAGDLAPVDSPAFRTTLHLLLSKYPEVIYVMGNHEFYGSDRPQVLRRLTDFTMRYPSFHLLENSSVEIRGQRFVGCTLWFQDDPKAFASRWRLNDFHVIQDFTSWVFDINRKSISYLRDTVKPGDIVVTHHIPVLKGSHRKWWGSPLQSFFLCDIEGIILSTSPRLWVYGHTHDSHDFMLGQTRLICNPFGYARQEENRDFKWDLVVDLGL